MKKIGLGLIAAASTIALALSAYAVSELRNIKTMKLKEIQLQQYETIFMALDEVGAFDNLEETEEGQLLKDSVLKTAKECSGKSYSIESGEIGYCIAAIKLEKHFK